MITIMLRLLVVCLLLWVPAIPAVAATASLWPVTTVPSLVDGGADNPVELGTAFQADVPGTVTGIRYYKSIANTGLHVGNLWTGTGVLLATGTFKNETTSGWQQLTLPSPVTIATNSRYVVSYHANAGHYSADLNYFANNGVDASPLHAPANGVGGGNGIFAYSPTSSFPVNTWNSANYWVDVIFQSGTQTGTLPPAVPSVSPSAGNNGVSINAVVTLTFSAPLNPSTVNTSTVFLTNGSVVMPAVVSYDSSRQMATLAPTSPLQVGVTYTATAKGGAGGITDTLGNAMLADYTWNFTTSTNYGAKGGGPGGPILIISDPTNPFSEYYAEIILAEGFNEFDLKPLSSITSTTLAAYDVVILGHCSLTATQVTMLSNWVTSGGNLVAMRPDKQLAALLGLSDTGSTLTQGYLLIDTGSGPGAGIVGQTIQFHGVADRYTLAGASSLATLYSGAQTQTANPAVTLKAVGTNGGQAAAFTFDLAQSIVYTRQGNPAWSGQERDGNPPIRSDDLFYGPASFDNQPNWVDFSKIAIPQADEQQRFLANLITFMNANKRLLPRFWYLPNGNQAAVVMTGDDHANGGTTGRFNRYLSLSSTTASTTDWGTIRATSYVFPSTTIPDSQAAAFNAAGFEIALHLNTNCGDFTPASLEDLFTIQLAQFASTFPSLPSPTTHRVHCIAWSDYTTMAETELSNGIRLDTSYYYWPPSWVANTPGLFTGSAIPMRFATATGNTIDVYQATTQMTDESGQTYPYTVDSLLDLALGSTGFYGVFVANMHTDTPSSPGSDWIISSAMSRGVPVISSRQLLQWCDAKTNSSIKSITWSGNTLSFSVARSTNANGLTAMAPILNGYAISRATFNGGSLPFTLRGIKGVQYALFPALSGSYQFTYIQDTAAPNVVSITPSQNSSGVYRKPSICIRFNEAIRPSSINTNSVTLFTGSNAIVPASVTYNPTNFTAAIAPAGLLNPSATFMLQVNKSVSDAAGNPMSTSLATSFSTGTATGPSYSIWGNSITPKVASASDSTNLELGTKFTSTKSGVVTAIRFYKGSGNTGSHTGTLWTSSGSQLASVNFTNETSTGWQTQVLPTPVRISADTPYVVSYHAPAGHYSVDTGYFAIAGVNNYPLRAPSDGENGGNGLFRSSKNTAFPNSTYSSSNYWVDVVFLPDP